MVSSESDRRLGWRGTRIGIYSGALGGGLSGFLAVNFWGFWELIPKLFRGGNLGVSDPATPQMVVANVIFNSLFFGLTFGLIFGALVGAVAGYRVSDNNAGQLRLGRWLGAIGLSLLGILLRPEGWLALLAFVIGNALIGATGGLSGDWLFSRLYLRRVGESTRPL